MSKSTLLTAAAVLFVGATTASAAVKYDHNGWNLSDGAGIFYDGSDSTVLGTAGDDYLVGLWDHNDGVVVKGGAGDDVFFAGDQQLETFFGGPGADRFVFHAESSDPIGVPDAIADFNAAEGDVIDLSFIDATTKKPGHQAFKYIGSAPFQGKSGTYAAAGQLRFEDGVLYGDTNGSFDEPEIVIALTGVTSLPASALKLEKGATGPAKAELRKITKAKKAAAKFIKKCKTKAGKVKQAKAKPTCKIARKAK